MAGNNTDRVGHLRLFKTSASVCKCCRNENRIYRHHDGRWAYPLFHEEGSCRAGILFVLEAPNLDDTFNPDKGRLTCDPDTDPSGQFMCELLASVKLDPSDVLFTNTVLCLPAKTDGKFPVTATLRNECRPWLIRLVNDLNPSVVVAVGGQALRALGQIERHELRLKSGAGRLHDWHGRKLLPLYHPSRLGRVTRSAEKQREDIKALVPYLLTR